MSLKSDVLEFIRLHPGVTVAEVSAAFPEVKTTLVNRAVQQLHSAEFTTRTGPGNKYQYTFNPDSQASVCSAAQELILKAEELESRGFYQRAASVWMVAFAASGITTEREMCLKRRKKCLAHSPCKRYSERMWDMAGRFNGDV